jgi:alkylation response protein AidB-like acyl-CoA dehydrogenase
MFDLALSDEQEELQKAYRSLLERECSPEVVRDCEATGHSDPLWRRMVELGVVDMAAPERL